MLYDSMIYTKEVITAIALLPMHNLNSFVNKGVLMFSLSVFIITLRFLAQSVYNESYPTYYYQKH